VSPFKNVEHANPAGEHGLVACGVATVREERDSTGVLHGHRRLIS
jgi:hypothetical protein